IKITFPAGYDISGASVAGSAACTNIDGNDSGSISGQVFTITRSSGTTSAAGAKVCTISGVKNPTVAGSTGTYTIQTSTSCDVARDQNTAVGANTITANALTSTSVTEGSLAAAANTTATANFTTVSSATATDKIKITFPAGYDVSAASGGTCTVFDGSFATSVSGQVVTITRSGGSSSGA